jgi:hypothetical protein
MAEPVQRTVGGRLRYVSCLRFTRANPTASYREPRERAIVYVDGRLDHVVEKCRRNLRRRGLCAVSGIGKDDALKPVWSEKALLLITAALKPARELRSLFSEV